MVNFLKKFVPRSFKKTIRQLVISSIGIDLQSKVDILVNMVYDLYPPLIIINKPAQTAIAAFQNKYDITTKLNANISKNDYMFKFLLIYSNGNFKNSFFEYLESGLNSFNVINKLAKKKKLWKVWLETHEKLCTHPTVVGISQHMLVICRKP